MIRLAVFLALITVSLQSTLLRADEPDVTLPAVKHLIDTHIHLYDTEREEGVPWPPENDAVLYKPHLPDEFKRVSETCRCHGRRDRGGQQST